MYAVIQTGGKQYRVQEGDVVRVELLEKEPKQSVVFDRVLLVAKDSDVKVGQPVVTGATVEAEVIGGKQLGRTLGYPTANMQLPPEINKDAALCLALKNTVKPEHSALESNRIGLKSSTRNMERMGGKLVVFQTDTFFEVTLSFPVTAP